MAMAFISSETHGVGSGIANAPSRALRPRAGQVFGSLMLAASGYITVAMFTGLSTAARLISEYEALHGPLQIQDRYWDHGNTPGSFVLCEQIDAAAGWLYPFGILAWFPVLALVLFGVSMTFERVRTISILVSVLTVGIVATAFYFNGTTGAVLAILE